MFTSALVSTPLWVQPAAAQSIFCPSNTVQGQIGNATGQPYTLQGGNCTNGPTGAGAFSGAALASQALSGLAQTSTTETNRNASGAVANRREQEQQRASSDNQAQARQNDERAAAERDRRRRRQTEDTRAEKQAAAAQARRASARASAARARQAEAREDAARKADADAALMAQRAKARADADRAAKAEARADKMRAGRVAARRDREMVEVAPPVRSGPRPLVRKGYDPEPVMPAYVYVPEQLRYGAFAQGFGDFEQRSGRVSSSITYDPSNGADPAQVQRSTFDILQKSTTRTAGFLGGIDMTKRNAFEAGDGLIFGVLGGYTDTSINISTRTIPTNGVTPPAGAASTRVSLSGPSVGAFATYFNGGFTFDQTLKMDFYRLDQTFSETAGFTGVTNATVGLTGAGKTDVTQFSAIGNLNYRYFVSDTVWLEPTVGYQYTNSAYDANASLLGLTDGYLVRVQGGARIGLDTYFGATRLTTTLTGLAYENVVIEGGFIQAGAFGSNVIALNDERKLRGQGILTFALDQGNGFSTFVQGDVRGGDQYFAAGGRAGFRYQW